MRCKRMSLYETWARRAYDKNAKPINSFWKDYMPREQAVYEKLIENNQTHIKGRLVDLAKEYNMALFEACGFFDGINSALNSEIDMKELNENSEIDVTFEFEKLFNIMVEYKAEHLYTLPQWNKIFSTEQQKHMIKSQKTSGTLIKPKKVGRNDPCPCGSGKKYKKCCALTESITEGSNSNEDAI